MTTSINKIMKNRKNKKGFSLIELIIVLVIMAILAAALVPTLVGYIRQTRQSTAKNEAAACVSAAQTISSSAFADPQGVYYNQTDPTKNITIDFTADTAWTDTVGSDATAAVTVVETLAEVGGSVTSVKISQNGQVTELKYTAGNGSAVVYNGSTYTVS